MTGPTIAIITEPARPGGEPDDAALYAALEAQGATGVPTPWGTPIDPGRFHAALVRTPWDYFRDPDGFFDWADSVQVPLFNPPRVLRWNGHKRYLLTLASRGVARIPATLLLGAEERPESAATLAGVLGAGKIVVKPAVSAGAHRTRVLNAEDRIDWTEEDVGDYIAQAFEPAVVERGEWSVTAFGNGVSHAVLKRPARGDFRVQEEHGGSLQLFPEVPADLKRAAQDILIVLKVHLGLKGPLVQARVDLVRDVETGAPKLMELELIEPELFLRARPGAADDLARELLRQVSLS